MRFKSCFALTSFLYAPIVFHLPFLFLCRYLSILSPPFLFYWDFKSFLSCFGVSDSYSLFHFLSVFILFLCFSRYESCCSLTHLCFLYQLYHLFFGLPRFVK